MPTSDPASLALLSVSRSLPMTKVSPYVFAAIVVVVALLFMHGIRQPRSRRPRPNAEEEDEVVKLYRKLARGHEDVYVLLYVESCPHCPSAIESFEQHRASARAKGDDAVAFVPVDANGALPFCQYCGIDEVPHFLCIRRQADGQLRVYLNDSYE